MTRSLKVNWLGRVNFADALARQEAIWQRKRAQLESPDELLLLEHDPVYTIGRTPDQSSLRGARHLPHPLFEINRGGQATYHGPGQLVGYFLLDLRHYGQDLHRNLRWIEGLLIELVAGHGIEATTRENLTGVWVEDRKIASIGVGVRHWITMHGFALNVCGDLSPFDQITPCGITNVKMTSLAQEIGIDLEVETLAAETATLAIESLHKLQPHSSTLLSLAV
jgi:lipoyl(octanoyl) transferase